MTFGAGVGAAMLIVCAMTLFPRGVEARTYEEMQAALSRIPLERIEAIGIDVRADIDANRTSVYDWENWVRRRLIERLLGRAAAGPKRQRNEMSTEIHVERLVGRRLSSVVAGLGCTRM